MRVDLRGGSGFVGANLAYVFGERHDAEVVAPAHEQVGSDRPADGMLQRLWSELDSGCLV
jgi:hypothetical protein